MELSLLWECPPTDPICISLCVPLVHTCSSAPSALPTGVCGIAFSVPPAYGSAIFINRPLLLMESALLSTCPLLLKLILLSVHTLLIEVAFLSVCPLLLGI